MQTFNQNGEIEMFIPKYLVWNTPLRYRVGQLHRSIGRGEYRIIDVKRDRRTGRSIVTAQRLYS